MAQRSPPHSPQLPNDEEEQSEGDNDVNDEVEVESPPPVVTQDPCSKKGSYDESDAIDEQRTSIIPKSDEVTTI